MYEYSGGADGKSNGDIFTNCGMAMLLAVLITIMVISTMKDKDKFRRSRRERLSSGGGAGGYGTNATDYAVANQISTQADVANYANRPLLMQPYQLKSYMNKLYPPTGTTVNSAGCIVSDSNDCPKDLYWKCNDQAWSKDAIGEALALSSVGSYYLPSGIEEENLHKVIALAHEPVTAACRDAGVGVGQDGMLGGIRPSNSPYGASQGWTRNLPHAYGGGP